MSRKFSCDGIFGMVPEFEVRSFGDSGLVETKVGGKDCRERDGGEKRKEWI